MRVLLDENVDRCLRPLFDAEYEVVTAGVQGWSGEKNGELLRLAAAEYDAFVTMDRNLPHQQNLGDVDLAVVVILGRSNSRQDIEPAVPQVNQVLRVIKAKELQIVQAYKAGTPAEKRAIGPPHRSVAKVTGYTKPFFGKPKTPKPFAPSRKVVVCLT